jgi:hypothetical protein
VQGQTKKGFGVRLPSLSFENFNVKFVRSKSISLHNSLVSIFSNMSTWQEQVGEAHAEVINDIKGKFKNISGGPSVIEGVKAFCAAVDWSVSF